MFMTVNSRGSHTSNPATGLARERVSRASLLNSPTETKIPSGRPSNSRHMTLSLVAFVIEVNRRQLRRVRGWRWIKCSGRKVLGAEDPIPRPRVGRFDHAFQGPHTRTTDAASSFVRVSLCHGLRYSKLHFWTLASLDNPWVRSA